MSTILQVRNMSISLPEKKLTEGISFDIEKGEILSLVGESGSGKSITALACCGLQPEPHGFLHEGSIKFEGRDVTKLSESEWCEIRGNDISMIFQEPGSSLNPLMTIQAQMVEYFEIHDQSDKNASLKCREMLQRVELEPDRIMKSYPHELSGGMQQRVMIAMALLMKPKLLIADEPTTALDVTVQAQIMDLLLELQEENGMSILFITHNLALVAQYCDRLILMQHGLIVEQSDVLKFLQSPQTEYGKLLLEAVPRL